MGVGAGDTATIGAGVAVGVGVGVAVGAGVGVFCMIIGGSSGMDMLLRAYPTATKPIRHANKRTAAAITYLLGTPPDFCFARVLGVTRFICVVSVASLS